MGCKRVEMRLSEEYYRKVMEVVEWSGAVNAQDAFDRAFFIYYKALKTGIDPENAFTDYSEYETREGTTLQFRITGKKRGAGSVSGCARPIFEMSPKGATLISSLAEQTNSLPEEVIAKALTFYGLSLRGKLSVRAPDGSEFNVDFPPNFWGNGGEGTKDKK